MSDSRSSSEAAVAAVVRKDLLALARRRGVEFQHVLSEFAIERLLFRLGQSEYRKSFVLKGATLFRLWTGDRGRATRDLDLLGSGESEVEAVVAALVHGSEMRTDPPSPRAKITPLGSCPASRGESSC